VVVVIDESTFVGAIVGGIDCDGTIIVVFVADVDVDADFDEDEDEGIDSVEEDVELVMR
jgi:hypothetical protein